MISIYFDLCACPIAILNNRRGIFHFGIFFNKTKSNLPSVILAFGEILKLLPY